MTQCSDSTEFISENELPRFVKTIQIGASSTFFSFFRSLLQSATQPIKAQFPFLSQMQKRSLDKAI